jgi:hypothetical protein
LAIKPTIINIKSKNLENKKIEIDITININTIKHVIMINGAIYSFIFKIFGFSFL